MILSDQEVARIAEQFSLSPREAQVARLIIDGVETKEAIAERLGISPGTVRTVMNRVFIKTRVHSKLGLALFMIRLGLEIRERNK